MSKKKKQKGENSPDCPYYQPSVQNQHVRTFFGMMKERYGWDYSFKKDFSFTGGLVPFLKKLYAKRHEEYGDDYGCGKNKKRLVESEQDKLERIGDLDESDITLHQIKLLFSNGMGWGLHGAQEHSNLQVKHISHGTFEKGHEFDGLL